MTWLPRTSSRIRREAAAWVARRGAGFDDADAEAFARWYADDRNAAAYDRLASIWTVAAKARPRAKGSGLTRRHRTPVARFALVGSLVVVVAVMGALLLGARATAPEQRTLMLASAVGQVTPYKLADGSRVVVDSASKVAVDYSANTRSLVLISGRARFEPTGGRRPFQVTAGSHLFRSEGSAFDLSLIDGLPTAHLLRGNLTIFDATRDRVGMKLTRGGQMVGFAPDASPSPMAVRAADLSWPRSMLEFDGTPLRDAVALANRYSNARIHLADAELGDLAVSGAFRAGDTAGLARSLAFAFGLKLDVLSSGNFLLSRASRSPPNPGGTR